MPSEQTQDNETQPSDPQPNKVRTAGETAGLVLVIFFAAGVTFVAMFVIGSIVGTRVSASGGPLNEHHMGHGVATGLIAGMLCSVAASILLFRRLFSH